MRTKSSKQSKLIQITKVPIKILCKARDVYVKGLLGFSNVSYGSTGMGGGVARLPKSFSANSSVEVNKAELRQLMRLKSKQKSEDANGMKTSYVIGLGKIGTINEDRACSFRAEIDLRSRTDAVRRKVVYH
ncbi:hypothetical protein M5689_000408 [Euphorbia peplus]|nr:hypothetical protein M5689_000408 [Euphorbia peplus]